MCNSSFSGLMTYAVGQDILCKALLRFAYELFHRLPCYILERTYSVWEGSLNL